MGKKWIDLFWIGLMLFVLVTLFYQAMRYFGFAWFDQPIALIVWVVLMAMVIKL